MPKSSSINLINTSNPTQILMHSLKKQKCECLFNEKVNTPIMLKANFFNNESNANKKQSISYNTPITKVFNTNFSNLNCDLTQLNSDINLTQLNKNKTSNKSISGEQKYYLNHKFFLSPNAINKKNNKGNFNNKNSFNNNIRPSISSHQNWDNYYLKQKQRYNNLKNLNTNKLRILCTKSVSATKHQKLKQKEKEYLQNYLSPMQRCTNSFNQKCDNFFEKKIYQVNVKDQILPCLLPFTSSQFFKYISFN